VRPESVVRVYFYPGSYWAGPEDAEDAEDAVASLYLHMPRISKNQGSDSRRRRSINNETV
jgi:hypothetical protein